MTLHYHGTPISPKRLLQELAGCCFCVPFTDGRDVERCHRIGQSVMLDNGAYTAWTKGHKPNWANYYKWVEPWLDYPTTWAVIPDVIAGDETANNDLIREWPFRDKGAPVWHLHESLDQLWLLVTNFPRVCFGSSGQYSVIGSDPWRRRVDQAFNLLAQHFKRLPWIHMLRGMALAGSEYPFASVDSTDIAQNHHLQIAPRFMAQRWDALQCPARWHVREQKELELWKANGTT